MKISLNMVLICLFLLLSIEVASLPSQAEANEIPSEEANYVDLLSEQIQFLLIYPKKAKKQKWEGIVRIQFLVKKDGSITDVNIVNSSGYPLLDKAALWAVKNASPYPFPFENKSAISVKLPLTFRLKKETRIKPQTHPLLHSPEEYYLILLNKIAPFLAYPWEAKEKDIKGTVKIKFLVKENGEITNIIIAKSSGSSLLDNAAFSAVENSGPLLSPLNIGKTETEIILPLTFGEVKKEKNQAVIELKKTPFTTAKIKPEINQIPAEESLPAKIETKTVSPGKPAKEESSFSAKTTNRLIDENHSSLGPLPPELKEFIKTALENNQPLQIAKEEINLAKIKIHEAIRNLYPALKLQAYNTAGNVYKVDYEEQEVKINLDQPLYYGGRLKNAYKQAKVNLEITKRNYDQQTLDTVYKTEIAYYTLMTLRMNLKKQNEILKEAEKILKVTENQHKRGVIIPLEFSNVKSWHERLQLQKDSITQELEMAHLTFKQVLNTQTFPLIKLSSLEEKEFDMNLSECREESLKSRPEIVLARLSVEFYEYNKKIEDAKDSFNVNLTGSYGCYQGGYKTESMKNAENWYIGFKVTKALGPNTLSASLTTEEAQPRFGQTSPTGSRTISAEFGILDNFKKMVEKKDAEIALLKAQSQLKETEKNITFEIQDAYLKCQKSLLELKSALSQKSFREEELKTNQIKVYRGEGDFPSLITTLVNLSEAEDTHLRALGNYYISLATLRKTSGYGLKL